MRKRMMEKLRKISTMYYLRQIVACLLVYCILLAVPMQVALAAPLNPVQVAGDPIDPYSGLGSDITGVHMGSSSRAVINWDSLDTLSDQELHFLKASGNFAVLNRVITGNDPTQFLGSLFGERGDIFIVNTRGIVFGPESFIQARNFVASGIDIANDDFMQVVQPDDGQFKFERNSSGYPFDDLIGDVTNEGINPLKGINAEQVALIGQNVTNKGIIRTTAPGGAVIMAAGERVLLSEVGSNVVVEVDMTGPDVSTVDNTGTIEASSGNVGKVVLAAGDIISTAISGVDSLAAVANRNIALGGDFEAGEITLTADADGVDGGYVYAGGIDPEDSLTSTNGDIEISASDNSKIQLNNVDIDAAKDLLLNNNTTVSPGKTLKAGQDVILAEGKTMKGYGALTVEADRDIILGGDVHSYGTMTLKADADTVDHETGAESGGIMWAKSTLGTIYGNIDIYGNAILLDNNVTAAQDLILNNDTDTNPGITLRAGNNVDSPAHLTAEGNLTIEATGGAITAHEIKMPAASAPDATLTLTQNDTLDLEQNVTVINRTNTHLVAKSTGTGLGEGSVTSIAAAQWKSITAAAQDSIILSDIGGDITTKVLTATTGNIEVTTDNYGQLLANDNITAHEGDVALYADDGIVVTAGKTIKAGQDVKIGYDEGTQAYNSDVTLTGEGDLFVEAARHMTLGGDVTANGNLNLLADYAGVPYKFHDGIGNMRAYGSVVTTTSEVPDSDLIVSGKNIQIDGFVKTAGNIEMYGGDDITLVDYVTANGDISLYANYVSGSGADLDYDDGVGDVHAMSSIKTTNSNLDVGGENIQLDGVVDIAGWIQLYADDNISLGNTVEADDYIELYADRDDNPDKTGLMLAESSITTTGIGAIGNEISVKGENIQIDGAVDSKGYIEMYADDNLTLGDTVEADDYIKLYADEDDDPDKTGLMLAESSITTTAGNGGYLEVYGEDIQVDGTVNIDGWIRMEADDDLTLASNVEAGDSIDFYSSDDTTYLGGDLIKAAGDLTLHNNTELNGTDDPTTPGVDESDQRIEATTGKLTTEGYVHKKNTGNLDMFGGFNGYWSVKTKEVRVEDGELDIAGNATVQLDGDIYSKGRMELTSNIDGEMSPGHLYHTLGTIQSLENDVDIDAINSYIYLHGGNPTEYVKAGGDILLYSDTYLLGDRKLHADDDVVLAGGKFLKTDWYQPYGDLTIEAVDDIILGVTDVAAHETTPAVGTGGLVRAYGDLLLDAGGDVYAHGELDVPVATSGDIDIYSTDGTTYLWDNVTAYGGGDVILHNNTVVKASDKTLMSNYDDVVLAGGMTLSSDYDLTIKAGDDIILGSKDADYHWKNPFDGTAGNVSANGDLTLMAPLGSVYAHGTLTTDPASGGDIEIYSSDATTYLWDNVTADVDVILHNDTEVKAADKKLDAGRDVILSDGKTLDSDYDLTIEADRDITLGGPVEAVDSFEAYAGLDTGLLGGTILAKDNIQAASIVLSASNGAGYSYSHVEVEAGKTLTSTTGDITVEAHHDVSLGGAVDSAVNLNIRADQHNNNQDVTHIYGGDVDADDTLTAAADIQISGNNIDLDEDVVAGGSIELTSDTSNDFMWEWWGLGNPYGEMYAAGDLLAGTDVTINGDLVFDGYDDQNVYAQTGMITANGWLWKNSQWGSLYLEADGNVSLDDSVKADNGGVSIISENGKIFTPDENDEETDTLNVAISGYSDQGTGAGVKLHPDMDNKAAIVVMSKEDLKLGEGAVLTAFGMYDNSGAVDDRAGVDFLDDGDPLTATIGGVLRDEGEPFDAAIYLASTGGDVHVGGPVNIMSNPRMFVTGEVPGNDIPEFEPQGAMVIDAFNRVIFGELFEGSLAGEGGFSFVGNRLEVVSRITEWLFQAVGRLPYPHGGGPFPLDYTYVLRGAGLDNPAITDGRAWVLEDPLPPAPLYEEAGQALEPLTLGLAGCPVLVAAVSVELGVPGDTIQVSLANSFALNTNIQPCESCARLLNAATILRDEDGSRMAAMNQVFNTVAPAGVPFTPEMAASIATAFAGRVNDGTQYATAIEYIDAFVRYLAVLDTEMGSPVADGDSIAFIMGKYGTGITDSDNSNIAAFVATRLESGATFGE